MKSTHSGVMRQNELGLRYQGTLSQGWNTQLNFYWKDKLLKNL